MEIHEHFEDKFNFKPNLTVQRYLSGIEYLLHQYYFNSVIKTFIMTTIKHEDYLTQIMTLLHFISYHQILGLKESQVD
jgi:hypothetical protein